MIEKYRRCFVGLTVGFLLTGLAGCSSKPTVVEKHKLTIGIQVSPAMALIMVAKDKGFFDQQNLDVQFQEFTAGKLALQAFLGGSLDFAVSGEVPVTLAALQGSSFQVLSQVVQRTTNEVRVVARRDGSITDAKAYFSKKKRKLATSFGGGPEFFTYNFLKHYGIAADKVEIIAQKPEDMPAALASGSVDAISVFDPFAYFGENTLGAKGITFSDPTLYSELYVIAARGADMTKSPDVAPAMMRALVQARDFIKADQNASKEIVLKYTKLDRTVLDAIWGGFVFAPALTNQLLEYQGLEAAWAKEKGTVPAGQPVPDFRKNLSPDALRLADPSAVEIH
jgi:ABC-type nitrate/sulfonate/bicarbonate transport system substrate-binding protein